MSFLLLDQNFQLLFQFFHCLLFCWLLRVRWVFFQLKVVQRIKTIFYHVFRSFSFKELRDLGPFFIMKIDPLYKIIILNEGPGCFDWSRVQMVDPILPALLGSPEVFPLRHYVEVSSNIIPHILASFTKNINKMNLIKVLSSVISSSIHLPLFNPFLRIWRA